MQTNLTGHPFVIESKPGKLSMRWKRINWLKHIVLGCLALITGLNVQSQCLAGYSFTVDSVKGNLTFTNTSVLANTDSPVTYKWTKSPGTVLSNATGPIIINLEPGTHHICLEMANAGCTNTYCEDITVPERYCKSNFTYTIDANGLVTFQSKSIGNHVNHDWSFGDGEFSIFPSPIHQFNQNGWYYVCLNIMNNDSSCNDVKCEFIRINKPSPTPCQANFDYGYDTLNSKLVQFTNATFSDSSLTYLWLFGDSDTSNLENPLHLFDTIGNYNVCLLVSGPNCADSICKIVEILLILPDCDAAFTATLFADSANHTKRIALFNNTSTGGNLKYVWNFGDDSASTAFAPIHYYAANGTYKVCLTAYNGNLCMDSTCTLLEILPDTSTGIAQPYSWRGVRIYPNPILETIYIDWYAEWQNPITITVKNMLGVVQSTTRFQTAIGKNTHSIDATSMQSGMYIVELEQNGNRLVQKVIK